MAYSRLIADAVCELVSGGMSIRKACAAVGISGPTFRRWVLEDVDGLAERSARAIEMGCDELAEQCLEISDEADRDRNRDGSTDWEVLGRSRLRVDTRLRLLGQWSKKYSPKSQVDQRVSGGVVVLKSTPEDESL